MIEASESSERWETRTLGSWTVEVATLVGPRIFGVRSSGVAMSFARLPETSIDYDGGTYRFHGGHRLWRAPEVPAVTYHSEDEPVVVHDGPGTVTVAGRPDGDGIVKSLQIAEAGSLLIVDHQLSNVGTSSVTVSPWSITQFAPGGTALLPMGRGPADPLGLWPNRSIALWPYTQLGDPELSVTDDVITIEASRRPSKLKIGLRHGRGWLAYHDGDVVFVKWATQRLDARYPDLGAAAQCYRDERFLELETLGPLTDLGPADVAVHREVWGLFRATVRDLPEVLASLPPEPEVGR